MDTSTINGPFSIAIYVKLPKGNHNIWHISQLTEAQIPYCRYDIFIKHTPNCNPTCQTSRRVVYRTRVFNVCSVRHWFHTTTHSGFASLSKFNFLKKYARTFHWICKKPQRHSLFFCAKCSSQFLQWAWRGFCGNCFPISTAKREHASKSFHWARLT